MLQSSSRFLKQLTDEASTTWAGSLFHTFTTFRLKKHLLSCNLLLFTFSLHLCPLKACPPPLSIKKSSVLTPFTILKIWIKSPRTLLFSSDVIPNSFNLSSSIAHAAGCWFHVVNEKSDSVVCLFSYSELSWRLCEMSGFVSVSHVYTRIVVVWWWKWLQK